MLLILASSCFISCARRGGTLGTEHQRKTGSIGEPIGAIDRDLEREGGREGGEREEGGSKIYISKHSP